MGLLIMIMWAVMSIGLWVLYHKMFSVAYFDLGMGIVRELIVVGLLGALLTGCALCFWWITAIIFIIAGLIGMASCKNPNAKVGVISIAVIMAILISIMGISVKVTQKKDNNTNSQSEVTRNVENLGESDNIVIYHIPG